MVDDRNIEILMLCDNRKRTIGAKREALKNISNGKYIMFVDDDDFLISVSEIYEAIQGQYDDIVDSDVISFKAECRNSDGSTYIVDMALGNEVEHNTEDGRYIDCKRPPFHMCAWHERFKQYSFADVNYSEDWEFVRQCNENAQIETHLDKVLFRYNFDSTVSEASTESNEFWTNPNEI